MKERIEKVIDEDINPALEIHQGSCEFVHFDANEGILTIRLKAACAGCPSSGLTLFTAIMPLLQEKLPEIKDVILD